MKEVEERRAREEAERQRIEEEARKAREALFYNGEDLLDTTEVNMQHHEKSCLRGFQPWQTQTWLYKHRRWLEA